MVVVINVPVIWSEWILCQQSNQIASLRWYKSGFNDTWHSNIFSKKPFSTWIKKNKKSRCMKSQDVKDILVVGRWCKTPRLYWPCWGCEKLCWNHTFGVIVMNRINFLGFLYLDDWACIKTELYCNFLFVCLRL